MRPLLVLAATLAQAMLYLHSGSLTTSHARRALRCLEGGETTVLRGLPDGILSAARRVIRWSRDPDLRRADRDGFRAEARSLLWLRALIVGALQAMEGS